MSNSDAPRKKQWNSISSVSSKAHLPPTQQAQVDAHVQAFLKSILSRAHRSCHNDKCGEPTRLTVDAETQTDDFDESATGYSCPDFPHSFSTLPVCRSASNRYLSDDVSRSNVSSCIPNREMYSRETLKFFSQQDSVSCKVRDELSSLSDVAQYFTGNTDSGNVDATRVFNVSSSNDVRRVITEWVQSYEKWFYDNFGVDVRTASAVASINAVGTSTADAAAGRMFVDDISCTASASAPTTQSPVVFSSPPISYLVHPGSVFAPEVQPCSPYVSLLPSFYTTAAYSSPRQLPMQHQFSNQTCLALLCPTQVSSIAQQSFLAGVPSNSSAPQLNFSNGTSAPTPVQRSFFGSQIPAASVLQDHISVPTPTEGEVQLNPSPLSDLQTDIRTSALLAALSLPILNGSQPSNSQWGPALHYGAYGRLPSPAELGALSRRVASVRPSSSPSRAPEDIGRAPLISTQKQKRKDKMPPPPPTFILLKRQAMICALQLCGRDRSRELFLRERESTSGIKLDYVLELEQLVEKTIDVKPAYIFTKLGHLPIAEKSYYLHSGATATMNFHLNGADVSCDRYCPSVEDMYLCDLLIGDVLISEACSTFKLQAQTCAARQAFKILSQPCFLVGSTRVWEEVEYLVLCLSPRAELVPQLPPFLNDPFETSFQSDLRTKPGDLSEHYEVVNPKPPDDLWLFISGMSLDCLDNEASVHQLLAQSAEFSQMTISHEVEVNMENGQFECSILVDSHRYPPVRCNSIPEALQLSALGLVHSLKASQPIVGSHADYSAYPGAQSSLWGVPDWVLTDTLMWGKEERDLPIEIEHLEAHCEVPPLKQLSKSEDSREEASTTYADDKVNRFSSKRHLDNFLQAYAASALVTPLRISPTMVPPDLWPVVRELASSWGLLTQIQLSTNFYGKRQALLVCKRAPLMRLKRTLYDHGQYGCFTLLDKGKLSGDALRRLYTYDPLIYDEVGDDSASSPHSAETYASPQPPLSSPTRLFGENDPFYDEPVTKLARRFLSTSNTLNAVKNEPSECGPTATSTEDCVLVSAELNQPFNAIEILDDLPRTLIPGIDF